MNFLAHRNEDHARESAHYLQDLGAAARALLEECVEHQIIHKPKITKTADLLDQAGFVFIIKTGVHLSPEYSIQPSLMGVEALEALEKLEMLENPQKS